MRVSPAQIFTKTDWPLLAAALLLSSFGLALIKSLSEPSENLFIKQFVFLLVGLLFMLAVQYLDRHFWRNASVLLYGAIIILLLGVLIFGAIRQGTQGWFDLGIVSFQPAEFAKIIIILFLATTLEKLDFDIANWRHLVLLALVLAIPLFLIALQPDFGPVITILATGGVMIFFTGLEKKQLLILFLAGVLIAASGWLVILRDYQKERIMTFLNPQSDPLGSGYNVRQSIVAIGSGGFWGRGLGRGTQSQLKFLPEQKTDFIFASIAEELGFVGAGAVMALYIFMLWRIYLLMRRGADLFSSFFLLGVFTYFLAQTAVNIGMNMGLLPVVGVTLPLVSYGGSSLVMSYLSLGIVQGVRGNR